LEKRKLTSRKWRWQRHVRGGGRCWTVNITWGGGRVEGPDNMFSDKRMPCRYQNLISLRDKNPQENHENHQGNQS